MTNNENQSLLNKPARQLTVELTMNKLSALPFNRRASVERRIWRGFNQGNTFISSIHNAWDGADELRELVARYKATA